jgi:hypothetical protein
MQTLVQVICKARQWQSLRNVITHDRKLGKFDLNVTLFLKRGRVGGWAKIHSENAYGVLNVEWDGRTKILSARVVTKRHSPPPKIISVFIEYLLSRHAAKIKSIIILPID